MIAVRKYGKINTNIMNHSRTQTYHLMPSCQYQYTSFRKSINLQSHTNEAQDVRLMRVKRCESETKSN
jgi:hypothetical protein